MFYKKKNDHRGSYPLSKVSFFSQSLYLHVFTILFQLKRRTRSWLDFAYIVGAYETRITHVLDINYLTCTQHDGGAREVRCQWAFVKSAIFNETKYIFLQNSFFSVFFYRLVFFIDKSNIVRPDKNPISRCTSSYYGEIISFFRIIIKKTENYKMFKTKQCCFPKFNPENRLSKTIFNQGFQIF